jgi:Protein of unknown function (DUF2510)
MVSMERMDEALLGWHPDPAQVGQLRWWNGHEWTRYVRNTAQHAPRDKSVGVTFVLTFFFGPLGLFYVSTSVAIAALIVNFVVVVLTLGLGLSLTWPAIIVLGCIMADRRHRRYQAWLLGNFRTPDGRLLAVQPPGSVPTPATQVLATRTSATERSVFDDTQRVLLVNGLACWQPDPTGRFELRWWSGDTWTPHVMNGDYRTTDPLWKC